MTTIASITEPTQPKNQVLVASSVSNPLPKKYQCPNCPQTFTRQHNLKSHLLIHSQQEKKFVCETCLSKFRRIHDLKRHLKLHTGERPYLCKTCGRRFARGDALVRHTKASVACSVSFISLEDSKIRKQQQDWKEKSPQPSEQHLPVSPDEIIKENSQMNYTTTPLSQGNKRSSISEILLTPSHHNSHLPALLNHSEPENNENIHHITTPPTTHIKYLPPLKQNSLQYRVPTPSNYLGNNYMQPPQPHPTHNLKTSNAALHELHHEPSHLAQYYEDRPPSPVQVAQQQLPPAHVAQQPQSQQQNWNNNLNSVPKDPFLVIRVLENRVRALEERLNSTESRVSFLETQLTGHHY